VKIDMFWVYNLPGWLFGVTTVAVFLLVGLSGFFATRRWVRSLHHRDYSYNDIVGFYLNGVTVLYGVTLGLLMVGVWTNFSDTDAKVDREAATVAAFYRDVSNYPEPARTQFRDNLRSYCRFVIDVAWPAQKKGLQPQGNLAALDNIQQQMAKFEPATEGQKILHAEAFRQFNQLVEERRIRLDSVNAGLSSSMWVLVLAGAFITLATTWFFDLKNQAMHFWMTALVSTLLGLMVYLLAVMDYPFRGQLSVSPAPFQVVYEQLMQSGK
jgi:hypothetical protein